MARTHNLLGGAASIPLGAWDYWQENWFANATAGMPNGWMGTAISSGSNSSAIPAAATLGFNSHGVFLRSGTTANGGYTYKTSNQSADYFGVKTHKFRCAFMSLSDFTGRTLRIGYHDSTTHADAVDGAYFELVDGVCSAKTASNSVRTTAATTATLTLGVAYVFDIEVNAAGTAARFRIYEGTDPEPIFDETITENLPTSTARGFGHGIVATEASTTASDIGVLYMLGEGTLAGFERERS